MNDSQHERGSEYENAIETSIMTSGPSGVRGKRSEERVDMSCGFDRTERWCATMAMTR